MHAYHNLPEGRALLLKLSNSMNSKRYFSELSDFIEVDEIKNLFKSLLIYILVKVILF